jgi:hypothetical protein
MARCVQLPSDGPWSRGVLLVFIEVQLCEPMFPEGHQDGDWGESPGYLRVPRRRRFEALSVSVILCLWSGGRDARPSISTYS